MKHRLPILSITFFFRHFVESITLYQRLMFWSKGHAARYNCYKYSVYYSQRIMSYLSMWSEIMSVISVILFFIKVCPHFLCLVFLCVVSALPQPFLLMLAVPTNRALSWTWVWYSRLTSLDLLIIEVIIAVVGGLTWRWQLMVYVCALMLDSLVNFELQSGNSVNTECQSRKRCKARTEDKSEK